MLALVVSLVGHHSTNGREWNREEMKSFSGGKIGDFFQLRCRLALTVENPGNNHVVGPSVISEFKAVGNSYK